MKKIFYDFFGLMIIFAAIHGSAFAARSDPDAFSDVTPDAWFYNDVITVNAKGNTVSKCRNLATN